MKKVKLYSGVGVSYSPDFVDGRVESNLVRLIADDGKMLFNGSRTALVIDVPKSEENSWDEEPYAEPDDEPTVEDKAEAYDILMGVSE